jgi:DNA-binding beta-propeller fold protein YncE
MPYMDDNKIKSILALSLILASFISYNHILFPFSTDIKDNNKHAALAFKPTPQTTQHQFIGIFGSYGTGNGQFNRPYGVAVNYSGYVYVSDAFNHRVHIISKNGTFITKWGTLGTDNSQFEFPYGVEVNPKTGNVYVSDAFNNRIQEFTSDGTFITKWGTLGTDNSQFHQPVGVTVDGINDKLYVSDLLNDRVQVFAPFNNASK